jgi:hypothetical protein
MPAGIIAARAAIAMISERASIDITRFGKIRGAATNSDNRCHKATRPLDACGRSTSRGRAVRSHQVAP